ncbi:hypothetical protein Z517_06453 [Fonsecaea pedrosoi CBS 271.37]|uniref:Unplaced genomic scaffold supercont1.4, whole genome shotgun sequence n=1 Tax=Fonsecaea pedrosoi CBS 271.37 TaxID=1442368 RepID=A0A0D2GGB4_9EURO|nr:uncharacterized protein Z517_06453 [Fonsecaea pedrosoi CBS 271.37]KIW79838.1 hypothetical protein Z517_06453 [Fonsecaea pedrosoi CBS 271.37]
MSATTTIADTPRPYTLQEKEIPAQAFETKSAFSMSIEPLVKALLCLRSPATEDELLRLRMVPAHVEETTVYLVLALYNTRKSDQLHVPVPDLRVLLDKIEYKTMEPFEPCKLIFYLLIKVVAIDLLVPHDPHKQLPPPSGPCRTYNPLEIIDAQIKSTQLTKLRTFVDFFHLDHLAREILPNLKNLESVQARDERTPQVIEEWKEMWARARENSPLKCQNLESMAIPAWLDYTIEKRRLPSGKINASDATGSLLRGLILNSRVLERFSQEDQKIVVEGGRLDRLFMILKMCAEIGPGFRVWMQMALALWVNALPGEIDLEKQWIWQIKPAVYEGPVTIMVKENCVTRGGEPVEGTMGTWAMLSPNGQKGFCTIQERPNETFLFDLGDLVLYGEQLVQLKNWKCWENGIWAQVKTDGRH